jgi:tetratricopeptide (TPR) repeat protein
MAKIDLFRIAVQERETIEACDLAAIIMDAMGKETPQEVFDFLDRSARKSPYAALACASSFFLRDMPQPDHRLKLLKRAARADDEELAADAYYALAVEYSLVEKTVRKALSALERAADLGHGDAYVRLARGYEFGLYRNRINVDRAYYNLCLCIDQLDYGPGKVALADFIIRHGIQSDEYNPIELLHEAAEEGVEGAQERLDALNEIAAEYKARLPYLIVPRDMNRPEMVRAAIVNELNVGEEFASELVARLFGFDGWGMLEATVIGGSHGESDYDEDCAPDDLHLRRSVQVTIIQEELDVPEDFAEVVWDLLRPTARSGKPSLRALDKTYKGRFF